MANNWRCMNAKKIPKTDGYQYYGIFSRSEEEYCCALTDLDNIDLEDREYCQPKKNIKLLPFDEAIEQFIKYYGNNIEFIRYGRVDLMDDHIFCEYILPYYRHNIDYEDYAIDVIAIKNPETNTYSILKCEWNIESNVFEWYTLHKHFVYSEKLKINIPTDAVTISKLEYYDDTVFDNHVELIQNEFIDNLNKKHNNLYTKVKEFDTDAYSSLCCNKIVKFNLAELEILIKEMKNNDITNIAMCPIVDNDYDGEFLSLPRMDIYALNGNKEIVFQKTKLNEINEFLNEFDKRV